MYDNLHHACIIISYTVADRVLAKPHHQLDNTSLNLKRVREVPAEIETKSNVLKIKNITKTVSEDTIKYYFQQQNKSGGGKLCSKPTLSPDQSEAEVVFQEANGNYNNHGIHIVQ